MELESAIAKAEAQQLESLLNLQYQKNMEFFASNNKDLYERFTNFTPTKVKLVLDENGSLNLKNLTALGNLVYPSDPMKFCEEYVDKFVATPNFFKVHFDKTGILDEEDEVHCVAGNKAIDVFSEHDHRRDELSRSHYNYLHINGIGMGYIAAAFLERVEVNYLVIFEPSDDVFYSSLFILDWQALFAAFEHKKKQLKLIVTDDKHTYYEQLRVFYNQIGLHNVLRPYVADHLSSKVIQNLTAEYIHKIVQSISAVGFFDDEQWSLAHTIQNCLAGTPPLRTHASLDGILVDKPAFVIANGPSLDQSRDFLIENRDKAVYISCGTTLGTLRKMGIKPDIHIEMERRYITYESVVANSDAEYRKGIIFLALNTVHPEVFQLFERSGMMLKPNDLGTHFFTQFLDEKTSCIRLGFCNPTVGNSGIAIAGGLGFENVYLFGLDLGLSADDKHHASNSVYSDLEDDTAEKMDEDYQRALKEVKGNFRDTVKTMPIFLMAIDAAEKAFILSRNSNYYNCSDGALLEGAEPKAFDSIELPDAFDTSAVASEVFQRRFDWDGIKEIDATALNGTVFQTALGVLDEIINEFGKGVESLSEAYELLDELHAYMHILAKRQDTQYVYTLLKGSVYSWNILHALALNRGETVEDSIVLFNQVSQAMLEFAHGAKKKIQTSIFEIDQKIVGFQEMMTAWYEQDL